MSTGRQMKLKRAMSVDQVLRSRKDVVDFDGDWELAFGKPEVKGSWMIYADSGHGKTTFCIKLAKELARLGYRVLYNSIEEGDSAAMQAIIARERLADVRNRFNLVSENMEELDARLSRRKSAQVVFIDSFQYSFLNKRTYYDWIKKYPQKLFIWVSHVEGKKPLGGAAVAVLYESRLKIFGEGFKFFSRGRTQGKRGYYVVWEEGAMRYWGEL